MHKSIPMGAAVMLLMLAATAVVAQTYPPPPPPTDPFPPQSARPIPKIQVTPRVRVQYYRDCVDWYAVEPRLTGPTVVPHSRCQWVKRYYAY
jgi:hypothetical protein